MQAKSECLFICDSDCNALMQAKSDSDWNEHLGEQCKLKASVYLSAIATEMNALHSGEQELKSVSVYLSAAFLVSEFKLYRVLTAQHTDVCIVQFYSIRYCT